MRALWAETLTLDMNPMLPLMNPMSPKEAAPILSVTSGQVICLAQTCATVGQAAHNCPLPDQFFSVSSLWD